MEIVTPQEIDVGIDVVVSGDRVEDEVESAGVLLQLIRIARDDDIVRSEAACIFLLVERSREDYNVGSERMSNFHAHVAQSAETDHANFLSLGDAPVAHRRVGCDSGAKQRSGSGGVQVCGDAQDEPLVVHDAVGVVVRQNQIARTMLTFQQPGGNNQPTCPRSSSVGFG